MLSLSWMEMSRLNVACGVFLYFITSFNLIHLPRAWPWTWREASVCNYWSHEFNSFGDYLFAYYMNSLEFMVKRGIIKDARDVKVHEVKR